MPTRYLRPGIRDSESIDKLSPLAEVMFYRLLVTVDDFGRTDARPSMLKAQCFPVKESVTKDDCEALLKELSDAGLVSVYAKDGKQFLQMRKWENVPRSKESKFPAPADGCTQVYAGADKPRTDLPVTGTGTGTGTGTVTGADEDDENGEQPKPSAAGLVCRAMRQAGLTDTNPSHPTLLALLEAGITEAELTDAAKAAVDNSAGFAYALKVAENRRRRAASIAPLPAAPPDPEEAARQQATAEAQRTAAYLAEQQAQRDAAKSPEAQRARREALAKLGGIVTVITPTTARTA